MISQPLVAIGKMDDATVGEAVVQDDVLHDMVVAMRVDADIPVVTEAEVDDGAEDAMRLGEACDTVDDMIRLIIVEPLPTLYLGIGGFRRRQEGEVGHDCAIVGNHVAPTLFNVTSDDI